MKLLALDMSKRNTGWAAWDGESLRPVSGSFELGSAITDNGLMFARVHERLMELKQVVDFDVIYIEQPLQPQAMSGGTTFHILYTLYGIAAHVESFACATGVRRVHMAGQSSWRSHFLKGMKRTKGQKADLKSLAQDKCKELGLTYRSHDEAEALGILDYACRQEGMTPPWRAHETLFATMEGRP